METKTLDGERGMLSEARLPVVMMEQIQFTMIVNEARI